MGCGVVKDTACKPVGTGAGEADDMELKLIFSSMSDGLWRKARHVRSNMEDEHVLSSISRLTWLGLFHIYHNMEK
jgi:hypothetical protein